MHTTTEAIQSLQAAGFKFPHELGLFRHPLLADDGSFIDPRTLGFEEVTTGGGCAALQLMVGEFRILLTSDDGCSVPDEDEWAEALIGVDVSEDRDEVTTVTGLQWLEMVCSLTGTVLSDEQLDSKSLPELSAWYVEEVGYDPLEDDPTLTPETFRADCKERLLIERCGGVDSEAYHSIEAKRKTSPKA